MKPIIAVDIDDVLSATTEDFIAFSNERYGLDLTIDDYSEHWAELWKVDLKETERRAAEYHTSGVMETYKLKENAHGALKHLKESYRLIAITSRESTTKELTLAWLSEHFSDVFDEVHFAGIFDGPLHLGMLNKTKADLFSSNKVQYVIDDQLKHCLAAVELGIEAVLFGDYPWNQTTEMPELMTRCTDWQAVKEYFDGRR